MSLPRSFILPALLAGTTLTMTLTQAQTVAWSNLDTVDTGGATLYNLVIRQGGGFVGLEAGMSFTTGAAAVDLDSVTLKMAASSTAPAGNFSVSLYADSGGPSVSVATLTGNSNPWTGGLETYTAPAHTTLTANTIYWLVASVPYGTVTSPTYVWAGGTSPGTGLPGWSSSGAMMQLYGNGVPATGWVAGPMVQASISVLDLEQQVADVPEASTCAAGLALLGAAGSVWWRQRRRG